MGQPQPDPKKEAFDSYSREILEEHLDHIVIPFTKNFHKDGTSGKEGKCSRAGKCKGNYGDPQYTVLERRGDSIYSIALCEECYWNSPFHNND